MEATGEPIPASFVIRYHSLQDAAFYTSDAFIEPLRKDVAALLASFTKRLEGHPWPEEALVIFKDIWARNGWNSIHLQCIALHTRVVFLKTIISVFIENINEEESFDHQMGALFALHTFFTTQPSPDVKNFGLLEIPIAADTYKYITMLPECLPTSLKGHAYRILQSFQLANSFFVLPDPSLPRQPPMYIPKTGRPSTAQTKARSLATTSALETFLTRLDSTENRGESERDSNKKKRKRQLLSNEGPPLPSLIAPDPKNYIARKMELKKILPQDILLAAEAEMRDTMDGIEAYAAERGIVTDTGWKGVEKLKTRKGMLDFLENRPEVNE